MSLKKKSKVSILNSPLSEVMMELSLPAIVAMVLFGLNGFLDAVFVGQLLGEIAFSGVALAYPLNTIVIGLASLIGTGAANTLSIALGQENRAILSGILPNTNTMVIIAALIFTPLAYSQTERMVRFMGGEGAILTDATTYFKVVSLGMVFWIYGFAQNLIIRGEGKMKRAAIMMSYGLMVNIVLNPLFIRILGMGVAGAAWATNVGMLVYCLVGYRYFRKERTPSLGDINTIGFDRAILKSMFSKGLPSLVVRIMNVVQYVVVFNIIAQIGEESDIAFFAAASRLQLFLLTPLFGLMIAFQPFAGINYGAGNYGRLKEGFRLFSLIGTLIIVPFWLLIVLYPGETLHILLPNRVFSSVRLWDFRIYMFILPFLPVFFMGLAAFPAMNRGRYATIVGLIRQLVLYIPAVVLISGQYGISGIFYAAAGVDSITILATMIAIGTLFHKLGRN